MVRGVLLTPVAAVAACLCAFGFPHLKTSALVRVFPPPSPFFFFLMDPPPPDIYPLPHPAALPILGRPSVGVEGQPAQHRQRAGVRVPGAERGVALRFPLDLLGRLPVFPARGDRGERKALPPA